MSSMKIVCILNVVIALMSVGLGNNIDYTDRTADKVDTPIFYLFITVKKVY